RATCPASQGNPRARKSKDGCSPAVQRDGHFSNPGRNLPPASGSQVVGNDSLRIWNRRKLNMGDTPTPEYAQFIEQTFTPMRLADGRTLRVPDSPPPCLADPESGFIWFKLPALWLLPPPYRPP